MDEIFQSGNFWSCLFNKYQIDDALHNLRRAFPRAYYTVEKILHSDQRVYNLYIKISKSSINKCI